MAEAILGDQKRVLASCVFLDGEYGVKGYYVGVPAVLGENGCEKVLEVTLNDEEQAAFDHSVSAVTNLVADMGRLGF
jgi:malate dehydrogenase